MPGAGLSDVVPLEAGERVAKVNVHDRGAPPTAKENSLRCQPERHGSIEAPRNTCAELAVLQEQLAGGTTLVKCEPLGHDPA